MPTSYRLYRSPSVVVRYFCNYFFFQAVTCNLFAGQRPFRYVVSILGLQAAMSTYFFLSLFVFQMI